MRSRPGRVPGSRREPAKTSTEALERAAAGDREALRGVVEGYRGMVARIARRLHGKGGSEELDDIVQVGMLALIEAVRRFDPRRGAFAAYASTTVSGAIKRHFRDRGWRIRVPRGLHDDVVAVRSASAALEGSLGRPPDDEELAETTELTVERVVAARRLIEDANPVSLDAPLGEVGTERGELIGGDDPAFDRAERRRTIGLLTAGLEAEDRELLARRFGLGQTQGEIAERVGESQMTVSRRLRRLLARLNARAGERGEQRSVRLRPGGRR